MASITMILRDDAGKVKEGTRYILPLPDLSFFYRVFQETLRYAIRKTDKEGGGGDDLHHIIPEK